MATLFLLWSCLQGYAFGGGITGTIRVKGLRSPAGVLVYLTKAPAVSMDLTDATFVMDQRNLSFVPQVLPVPVGAKIHFPNNDKVDHNVFSLSRTKKFSLGSYKPGETKIVHFDRPGIVELRCDVHAEMLAHILVMKNPYWAVTDKNGRFEIPDTKRKNHGLTGIPSPPEGKYVLKTWHEKLKGKRKKVVILDNEPATVHVELTRGSPSVLYK